MGTLHTEIGIVGGGVAGLALLAAMRQQGHSAIALERSVGSQPRGMGFILMPNGVRALDALFPGLDWAGISTPLDEARMRMADGSMIRNEYLQSTVCVSRAGLIDEMLRQLGDTGPLTNSAAARVVSDGDIVKSIELEDGRSLQAKAFVGCDGIHSKMRGWMHPSAALVPAGVTELVSVFEAPELARSLERSFLKFHAPDGGIALGMVPAGDNVIWYLQHADSQLDLRGLDAAQIKAAIAPVLRGWPDPVDALLEQTDFNASHLWHLADLDPLATYTRGNMLLVGDAAHPLLSFTSQGASAAIEDACLLAELFGGSNSPESIQQAYAKFDRIRQPVFSDWVQQGRDMLKRFMQSPSMDMSLPLAK